MTSEVPSPKSPVRVTATEASPVAYSLDVEVDAKRVRKAFDRAYRDLGKKVRIRGFRPGKAPRSVLEKLYGPSVAEQLEHTLVAETLSEAIEQSGIEPVAEPAIDAPTPDADSDYRYTVHVEVKPVVELPDTRGLPALRPDVDVSDEDVDERLESLRQRHAPVVEEPEGTEIAEGHFATIDFVGRIDGEAFEGGSGQGVEVEVGAGHFIPGFEEQLVGAAAGDDCEVRVTFPAAYQNRELAGKEAVFACHVVAVKSRQLPELDDEFAKDMGDFDSLGALRQRIRDDLVAARERESKQVFRNSLVDALIERTDFQVPAGMIERQLERQLQAAHQRLHGQVPDEAIHQQLEQWRDRAERDVREGLILEAVARSQGIQAEEAEIDARIASMAEEQGVDPEVLRKATGDEGLRRALAAQVVDEKVLDFLAGEAKVEDKTDT